MGTQFTQEVVTGGITPTTGLMDAIGKAATRIEQIATEMADAKEQDTARWQALNEERKSQAVELSKLQEQFAKAKMEEETADAVASVAEMKAQLAQMRSPSKAGAIGAVRAGGRYEPGTFLGAIMDARSGDPDARLAAKATLDRLASAYGRDEGKATLGATDATGGWILPNAIVDQLIIPGTVDNIYRRLMTVVNNVATFQIDMPYRDAARAAAVIAPWGNTIENKDLAYQAYTATVYTLARVYDLGAQFVQFSRGAAEQDVMTELAAAFAQGESYYIREGSGSSQPYGYTGALTNGPGSFKTTFTPSSTTLAGSIARSIADATGALAGRGVKPTAAVMSASSYWTMVSQGTDTAGFFFNPAGGPTGIAPGTLMSPFGIPVYADAAADLQGTAAVTDNLVVADWSKFKLYFGSTYRVDVSDVAGTRWDTLTVGFRGTEQMAFDARPAVYAGHAQIITDIVP